MQDYSRSPRDTESINQEAFSLAGKPISKEHYAISIRPFTAK